VRVPTNVVEPENAKRRARPRSPSKRRESQKKEKPFQRHHSKKKKQNDTATQPTQKTVSLGKKKKKISTFARNQQKRQG